MFFTGMTISGTVQVLTSYISDGHNAVSNRLRAVDPLWLLLGTVGGTVVYLKVIHLYRRSEEPLLKRSVIFILFQVALPVTIACSNLYLIV